MWVNRCPNPLIFWLNNSRTLFSGMQYIHWTNGCHLVLYPQHLEYTGLGTEEWNEWTFVPSFPGNHLQTRTEPRVSRRVLLSLSYTGCPTPSTWLLLPSHLYSSSCSRLHFEKKGTGENLTSLGLRNLGLFLCVRVAQWITIRKI